MSLTWQQAMGLETSHLVTFTHPTLVKEIQVHKDLVSPLSTLLTAAHKDGHTITIVSGFRDFNRQLAIWNDKWQGFRPVYSRHGRPLNVNQMSDIEKYKAIALWSALPGLSRHHWGTDFDIFSTDAIDGGYQVELIPEEFQNGGPCAKLEGWLRQNLKRYGFFRPYSEYRQGVCEEPWHISFAPVAEEILKNFDYKACRHYLGQSTIKASRFIEEQLDHYREKYFTNLCEPAGEPENGPNP